MTSAQFMSIAQPRPRRWTREEYYRMADLGLFEGQRVELIAGEVVQMALQSNPHYVAIGLVQDALRRAFGENHWIRVQGPLHAVDESEPEPDVAVVSGHPRDYKDHPRTALLVVEISGEHSLTYDAQRKANLYAASGISDYWILNLEEESVIVFRKPTPDSNEEFGARYSDSKTLYANDAVSPLAMPQVQIRVADLLP